MLTGLNQGVLDIAMYKNCMKGIAALLVVTHMLEGRSKSAPKYSKGTRQEIKREVKLQIISFDKMCFEHMDYLLKCLPYDSESITRSAGLLAHKENSWGLPAFSPQYHVLPDLIKQYNLKRGCEVGVLFGTQSVAILQESNIEHLYCVDPFKSYEEHNNLVGGFSQPDFDVLHKLVELRLGQYPSRATVIREPSPQASVHIPNHSLDFVYIDGDHSKDAVAADLEAWYPKVRSGGFIIGDDYCGGWKSVIAAVDAFVARRKLKMRRAGSRMYIIQKP